MSRTGRSSFHETIAVGRADDDRLMVVSLTNTTFVRLGDHRLKHILLGVCNDDEIANDEVLVMRPRPRQALLVFRFARRPNRTIIHRLAMRLRRALPHHGEWNPLLVRQAQRDGVRWTTVTPTPFAGV